MKITVTKEWFRSRAHLEEGHEIGAGSLRQTNMLKRLFLVLTFPVWVSLALLVLALVFTYNMFLITIGSFSYWLITGKNIMKSKWNIFDIR